MIECRVIAISGTSFGVAVGYPVFGYVADTIGWQYIFHLTSLCGVLWYLAWQYLVYDTPEDHPRISQQEESYIKTRLGTTVAREKVHTRLFESRWSSSSTD